MANPEIQTVSIALSADEAIVLFEILAREIDGNNGSRLRPFTSHEGELWALNGPIRDVKKAHLAHGRFPTSTRQTVQIITDQGSEQGFLEVPVTPGTFG